MTKQPPGAGAPLTASSALGLRLRWGSLWRPLLGLALGLLLLLLAARGVDLQGVWAGVRRADPGWVVLALLAVLLTTAAKVGRWRGLFPPRGDLALRSLARALLIGQLVNALLPARLGEVARIYFVGQTESRSRARTLGTIAVEKWLDILMLLLLVLLVPIFVSLPPWFHDSRANLAVFAIAFFGLALALSYGKDRLLSLVKSLSRFLPEGWRTRIHRATGLALGSLDVLRSPWVGLKLQGWSLLIWTLSILVNYTVFLALGLPLPFAAAVFLVVVLEVGVAVPSVPGKLGVFHYLCTLALGVFGLEKGAALGYAVLLYFVVFGPPALLGALFLWWESVHQPVPLSPPNFRGEAPRSVPPELGGKGGWRSEP